MPTPKRRSASTHSTDFDDVDETHGDSRDWELAEAIQTQADDAGTQDLTPLPATGRLPALIEQPHAAEAGAFADGLPHWGDWSDWAGVHLSLPLHGLRPWASWVQRSRDNAMLAVSVWSWNTQPLQTLDELQALQQASRHQAEQLLQQWAQRWAELLKHQRSLGQPNTMSKWTEEQFNLLGQTMELFSQQAVDLANLDENLSVNFGYWAQQKLDRQVEAI